MKAANTNVKRSNFSIKLKNPQNIKLLAFLPFIKKKLYSIEVDDDIIEEMIMNSLATIPPLQLLKMLQEMLPDTDLAFLSLLIQELWNLILEADSNLTGIPAVLEADYKIEFEKKEQEKSRKEESILKTRSFGRKINEKKLTDQSNKQTFDSKNYQLEYQNDNITNDKNENESINELKSFLPSRRERNEREYSRERNERADRDDYDYKKREYSRERNEKKRKRSPRHSSRSDYHYHRERRERENIEKRKLSPEMFNRKRHAYRSSRDGESNSNSHNRYDDNDSPFSPISNSEEERRHSRRSFHHHQSKRNDY